MSVNLVCFTDIMAHQLDKKAKKLACRSNFFSYYILNAIHSKQTKGVNYCGIKLPNESVIRK